MAVNDRHSSPAARIRAAAVDVEVDRTGSSGVARRAGDERAHPADPPFLDVHGEGVDGDRSCRNASLAATSRSQPSTSSWAGQFAAARGTARTCRAASLTLDGSGTGDSLSPSWVVS